MNNMKWLKLEQQKDDVYGCTFHHKNTQCMPFVLYNKAESRSIHFDEIIPWKRAHDGCN